MYKPLCPKMDFTLHLIRYADSLKKKPISQMKYFPSELSLNTSTSASQNWTGCFQWPTHLAMIEACSGLHWKRLPTPLFLQAPVCLLPCRETSQYTLLKFLYLSKSTDSVIWLALLCFLYRNQIIMCLHSLSTNVMF